MNERPEMVTEARADIFDALRKIPPTSDAVCATEWVLCAAWIDAEGETWMTRLTSDSKMPTYRIEGLLRISESFNWDDYALPGDLDAP